MLWLALLPFLFGNLAGWMCSTRTRRSGWRFKLHRLSHGLSGLALTINAVLVAVLISADLLAYQAVRAGRAGNQWWLAPLGWHEIAGYPARQLSLGVLVELDTGEGAGRFAYYSKLKTILPRCPLRSISRCASATSET